MKSLVDTGVPIVHDRYYFFFLQSTSTEKYNNLGLIFLHKLTISQVL